MGYIENVCVFSFVNLSHFIKAHTAMELAKEVYRKSK